MHIENVKFSVLMSIYRKENPKWFIVAVESVINQTFPPDEIVIVEDGPLTKELYKVCEQLKQRYSDQIILMPIENNVGLGLALRYGVTQCRHELIARMDTDDIAQKDRFELQVKEFINNPELSICGGWIEEFQDDPALPISIRKVPQTKWEIYEFAKRRNPFNHMTVMFRKHDVIEAGNYQDFPLMEDYYLWYRMLRINKVAENINKILVSVRVGNGMTKKRSGMKYFYNEKKLYGLFYKESYIKWHEYIITIMIRLCVRIMPDSVRQIVYKKIIRC